MLDGEYSGLNLNRSGVASPCRTICTVCGSPPCPDLNLIHYILKGTILKGTPSESGKRVLL
ncbi:hypothetical protein EEF03_07510 [Neisseria gonorrhoeae]